MSDNTTTGSSASAAESNELAVPLLRNQVNDLLTQVTQLNAKLVSSYDRISDLEDEVHISSSQLRQSSLRINDMQLEREKHRAMIEGGLLVEKAHVTQELTRLMVEASLSERKGEEDRTQRQRMEKELDELSAGLFEQANNMVREARITRDEEAGKRELAESSLTRSEELVRSLQGRLGELTTELQLVQAGHHHSSASKTQGAPLSTRQLLSTSQPYTEFLLFIAHLRTLHSSSQTQPSMSTLLSLPWLNRVGIEDVDPTLRLDLAPALNWLSRRSVLSSIHNCSLILEPVAPAYFQEHSHPPTCSLCGVPVFSTGGAGPQTSPSSTWSVDKFKRSFVGHHSDSRSIDRHSVATASSQYSSPPPTPPRIRTPPPATNQPRHKATASSDSSSSPFPASQIYIFCVSPQLPTASSSAANFNGGGTSNAVTQTYTLCTTGTCFARLRATCALFSFIRNEVVGGVWREEISSLPLLPDTPHKPHRSPQKTGLSAFAPNLSTLGGGMRSGNHNHPHHAEGDVASNGSPPPVPPRKRSLWGTMTTAWSSVASPNSPTRNSSSTANRPQSSPPPGLPAGNVRRVPPALPPLPPPKSSSEEERESATLVEGTADRGSSSQLLPSIMANSSSEDATNSQTTNIAAPPLPPRRSASRKKSTAFPTITSSDPATAEAESSPTGGEPKPDDVLFDHTDHDHDQGNANRNTKDDELATVDNTQTSPTTNTTDVSTPPPSEETSTTNSEMITNPAPSAPVPVAPPPIPRRAAKRGTSSRPLSMVAVGDSKPASPAPPTDSGAPTPTAVEETVNNGDSENARAPKEPQSNTATEGSSEISTEVEPNLGSSTDSADTNGKNDDDKERSKSESDGVVESGEGVETSRKESGSEPVNESNEGEIDGKVIKTNVGDDGEEGLKTGVMAGKDEGESEGVVLIGTGETSAQDVDRARAVTPTPANPSSGLKNGATAEGKEGGHGEETISVVSSTSSSPLPANGAGAGGIDPGLYISARTWEERTWKELSRLREEMFWSRSGGILI